jgi:hypothetical protein
MQKEQQRQALVRMHHHLSRQFPEMCPITLDAGPVQAENHPVPVPAGIGKTASTDEVTPGFPAPAAAVKAEPEQAGMFADADVYKGFRKMRKKLGKKVLSGKMTVDEARAMMGRRFTQKGTGTVPATYITPGDPNMTPSQVKELQDSLNKTAAGNVIVLPPGAKVAGPQGDVAIHATPAPPALGDIEGAVTKAVAPLLEKIREQGEAFTTKLADQQKVIDAIADQPDPSTAAFSGLAFKSAAKPGRPAGVTEIAEAAARAQMMVRRNLENTYYNHSDPRIREAAGQSLGNLGTEAAS